jgi:hypothetical protein
MLPSSQQTVHDDYARLHVTMMRPPADQQAARVDWRLAQDKLSASATSYTFTFSRETPFLAGSTATLLL